MLKLTEFLHMRGSDIISTRSMKAARDQYPDSQPLKDVSGKAESFGMKHRWTKGDYIENNYTTSKGQAKFVKK